MNIPWYISFITKQNQLSLALELLKPCFTVYIVLYMYIFQPCLITFQYSVFKCFEEFDSSSFHHYLVSTLLHVFLYCSDFYSPFDVCKYILGRWRCIIVPYKFRALIMVYHNYITLLQIRYYIEQFTISIKTQFRISFFVVSFVIRMKNCACVSLS